jgi:adenylate cyclase class 2
VRPGEAGGAKVETEVKLRLADRAAAVRRLRELGATLARPRHLEDNVLYDYPDGRLRAAGRTLRLRRTGEGGGLLTCKGPVQGASLVKARQEAELLVSDPEAMEAILLALGVVPCFRYEKQRETWSWGDAEIAVDETPLGAFLEVEAPPGRIEEVARALGFSPADFITASYPELHAASGRGGDMTF